MLKAAELLNSNRGYFAISVPRADNFKEKVTEVKQFLVLKCRKKEISLISHDNISPENYLNKSKLHLVTTLTVLLLGI